MAAIGRMKSPTLVFFSPPHLPRNRTAFGLDGREQVHDGRRHRAAHAEVQDRDVLGRGRLHRLVAAHHLDAEPLGEQLDVVGEVAQQDVLAELVQRPPGVARQPVLDDLGLGLHDAVPRSDLSSAIR